MIKIVIISMLALAVIAIRPRPHHEPECERCDSPCDECENGPRIDSHYFTDAIEQTVSEVTILTCTPESYFTSVVYEEPYQLNTTCWGFEQTRDWSQDVIYTGIRSNGDRVDLRGKPYIRTVSSNNGNINRLEQAPLEGCDQCDGDELWAVSDYVADDPITGCCDLERCDVDRLTGVAFSLKIFGRCCSTCTLQSSQIVYPRAINDESP